jgi:hypothetical protein
MDVAAMLQEMRDPMGVPFHPWFFQGLMVFFFALHIFMINIAMGSAAVALWGRWKGGEFPGRLSAALARAVTVHLSLAVLLGIVPLLFVQVIYDPFWYSSTSLSAWWAMLFVLAVMSGFLALYAFYLRGRRRPGAGSVFGLFALGCILGGGMVMHLLSMQALAPERWAEWFAPAGKMVTSGWGFHAFSPGRFFHFIAPAFIQTGIFLMLYAWYLSPRPDADPAYLRWAASAGARMAGYAALAEAATGGWFLIEVPGEFRFALDPFLLAGSALGVALIVLLFAARRDPIRYALPAVLLAFATNLIMAAARESLRMDYVGRYGYSVYDYPLHLDWGSTMFFLGTLAVGLVVTAYPVLIAFKVGRRGPLGEEG